MGCALHMVNSPFWCDSELQFLGRRLRGYLGLEQYYRLKIAVYLLITVRRRSCGEVVFSQACVKNSVHWWGCLPDTPPRQADTPLGRQPPLWQADALPDRQTPNPGQTPPLWQADNVPPSRRLLQRTVRILLECILVRHCENYLLRPDFSIPFDNSRVNL